MHSEEKRVNYKNTNTYSTLNTLTDQTKNIWLVYHGMGYLSRYFVNYFKHLNPSENYIIAPQAPSKYYQGSDFRHVGASWLTKEQTTLETQNVLNYIDGILEVELTKVKAPRLIVLGYSQGVSIALRYISSRQLRCDDLIIHSGGIPNELEAENFHFFKGNVSLVYGLNDEYLTEERITKEKAKAHLLFGEDIVIQPFEGKHEMNLGLVESILND